MAAPVIAVLLLAGCGAGAGPAPGSGEPSSRASGAKATASASAAPGPSASGPAASGPAVTLAFAGDVHFEGSSAAALGGDLGSAAGALARADVAVVNLETAVTTRGTPAVKEFTFRAPPRAFDALRTAGVDVVTLANNHGMDYGVTGLTDTLAAARSGRVALVGAGVDAAAADTPWRRTVRGVRVSVFGATDVLDTSTVGSWTATDDRPGLASAKDPARLLAAVRAERARTDVLAVDLHWGVERQTCPTPRQRELARLLADAGADVVVGSHAHVLQPQAVVGRTTVHYGLGNFVFYAAGGPAARSGVFTVTAGRGGVRSTRWEPAAIRAGRPVLLAGADARTEAARQAELARSCGVR